MRQARTKQLSKHAPLAGEHQLLRQERRPSGDQLPVYGIKFELYENGISRSLALDYNDFVVAGTMTSLEIRPTTPCK